MQTRREFIKTASAALLFASGCSRDAPDPRINESKIVVDVPLFDAIWKLDSQIDEYGIYGMGIEFDRPEELKNGGYWCTPTNSLAFAGTGGDGVHFSFIVRDSRVDSDSPILLTAPSNSDNANVILAENFRSFLRLGLRRGYFALEQFSYNPKETLRAYGVSDWQPSDHSRYLVDFLPDEDQRNVIEFVAKSLDLEPLSYTPEEFAALQERFLPMLKLPVGYEGM